jgi:hypothetical protein
VHAWLDSKLGLDEQALRSELAAIATGLTATPVVHHNILTIDDVRKMVAILDLISSLQPKWEDHAVAIEAIRTKLDPNQPMPGCACCGEVFATEMERCRDGSDITGYSVPLCDLELLQLSAEERSAYNASDSTFRLCRSVYPVSEINHPDTYPLYHLHPEFVSPPLCGNGKLRAVPTVPPGSVQADCANLCKNCYNNVKHLNKIPKFSLKAGCDYGDIRRLPGEYRALSTGESMAVSRARPYSIMIKLMINQLPANRMKRRSGSSRAAGRSVAPPLHTQGTLNIH